MNSSITANSTRIAIEFLSVFQVYCKNVASFKWRLVSKFGFRTRSNLRKYDNKALCFVKSCMKKD